MDKKKHILASIILIFIIGGVFSVWQKGWFSKIPFLQSIKNQNKTAECSPIQFSGYEIAKNNKDGPLEFYIDLNGDNKEEIVRVYRDSKGDCERVKPTMVKVFSGTADCPKEVFTYYGKGNETRSAEMFSNFWGDGLNAVSIEDFSYGCGCGGTINLMFLTYREGEYSIVEGPQVAGLGKLYMFDGENGLGKKIIVAEEKWASNSSDYCCGCTRKLQFIIYNWDGEKYVKTLAGLTKNRYSYESSIDEITQKEPSVLIRQTYKNEEYGFEIKFPEFSDYTFRVNNRDVGRDDDESRNIQFNYEPKEGIGLESIYIQELSSEMKEKITANAIKNASTVIAGYEADTYLIPSGYALGELGDSRQTLVIIFKKNSHFFIRVSPNNSIYLEEFFNQIISTFKFIK